MGCVSTLRRGLCACPGADSLSDSLSQRSERVRVGICASGRVKTTCCVPLMCHVTCAALRPTLRNAQKPKPQNARAASGSPDREGEKHVSGAVRTPSTDAVTGRVS